MRHKSPVHGEGNVRVKGADRTSVLGEAKTVQPFAVVGIIYPPFSLSSFISRRPTPPPTCTASCSSSSFMSGEVTDLLTMAVDKAAVTKLVRSEDASEEGDQRRDFVATADLLQFYY